MDCDSEDPIDEAGSDADSDTDSDTSDEIWLFDTDRTSTSVQDLSIAGAHTSNVDDERPCTPHSPSPTLPIVTNWHFSRSFHFYFIALTLVVIVQSLAQTQTYIP